jgi:hypothetical protein
MRSFAQVADRIYFEIFGRIDDKRFSARKRREIEDWSYNGDVDDMTESELVAEWRNYDALEIRERNC